MKRIIYIFLLFSLTFKAQDSITKKFNLPEINGYLKYMEQFSFIDNPDTNSATSLIHNRFNLKWSKKNWLLRLGMRNRIFYGDQLKLNPNFMKIIGEDQGAVNISKVWVQGYNIAIHSIIDRALINYNKNHWDVTVGRQRINWGVNMVWNPNDIFNAYNYFDFDYEERPGSDAVRVQYMWKGFSAIEVAAKKGKNADDYTAAMLFRSNKKGYDFQTLAGVAQKDLLLGLGWAGNIKNAGFKGEFTYFHPYEHINDTTGVLSGCMSLDYSFKNGLYLHVSSYYNSKGNETLNTLSTQQFLNVSAKQLLPFKYSGFFQLSKQINPLFTIGLSNIYSPTNNTWIVVPDIQYSMATNWEITLLGQSFFADKNNVYRSIGNSIFLRLKWSF